MKWSPPTGITAVWATEPSKKTTISRGAGADVDQADTQFALVGRDSRFGRGNALKDGVRYFEPRLVGAGHDALRRAGGAGGDVEIHLQPIAHHATGSWMPGCSSRMNCCGNR